MKNKTKPHTRHDGIASGMFSGTSHLLSVAPKRTHNFPHHHPTPKLLLLLLLHFLLHARPTSWPTPVPGQPLLPSDHEAPSPLFNPLSLSMPGSSHRIPCLPGCCLSYSRTSCCLLSLFCLFIQWHLLLP